MTIAPEIGLCVIVGASSMVVGFVFGFILAVWSVRMGVRISTGDNYPLDKPRAISQEETI